MIDVYTADEARRADQAILEGLGLPGIALMESAAAGLASHVVASHAASASEGVVVVCGPGNNGGDGYACARRLHALGLPVSLWAPVEPSTPDARTMRAVALKAGVPLVDAIGDAGVVVDAVFGTGLARPVEGAWAEVVGAIAAFEGEVVAADLPSGLCADTGRVLGVAARADRTVTFGGLKRGMFAGEGPARCGEVEVVELGFDRRVSCASALVEAGDVARVWPRRSWSDHKTRRGHLLVVAGSTAMAGAGVLAVRGALAAGVGLVTLATPRGALSRLGALPAEAMVVAAGDGDRWDGTLPDLDRFDAVAIGPGLGGGRPLAGVVAQAVRALHEAFTGPMVVDADALPVVVGPGAGPRVRTPHPGEAARLLGEEGPDPRQDRFAAVDALASDGVVSLLKGPFTLVRGRRPTRINPTGDPVLATGGSGDVLTGLVGALLAQGLAPVDAAMAAAWVHGAAGEHLASERVTGWTASDIAAAVPQVVETWWGSGRGLPRRTGPHG